VTKQDAAAGDGEPTDKVTSDELLYSRVLRDRTPPQYQRGTGTLLVLAQAFSQRPIGEGGPFAGQYRLSVDRAKLRGFDPDLTRRADPRLDPAMVGVVSLPAGEVRSLSGVADILPDPIRDDPDLPDNPAHALICVAYDAAQTSSARRRHFDIVRQELADLANRRPWAVEPPSA